jgi:hypothetical protein
MVVLGLAAPALLVMFRAARPGILVFAAYAALSFALALGNGFRNATYSSEVIIGMIVSAGIVVHYLPLAAIGRTVAGGLAIAAVFTTVLAGSGLKAPERDALSVAVQELPRSLPSRARVLVNYERETYAAYLPEFDFEATEGPASVKARPLGRGHGPFEFILLDQRYAHPDAVRQLEPEYVRVREFNSSQTTGNIVLMRTKTPPAEGGSARKLAESSL